MNQPQKLQLLNDDIFTVRNLFSEQECLELIAQSENSGYEAATVHTASGHQMVQDWRNNTRVTLDDGNRALVLWQKVAHFVPSSIEGCRACGINERLRFYRYDPGQKFDWHTDGYYRRPNGEQSFLTFMVYLNEGCVGGETRFRLDPDDTANDLVVTPELGMALFFSHPLLHQGAPVTQGRKYVLRTDVMYTSMA